MVSLKIEVRKKDVTWVVLLVAVLVVGVVYAYGTSNPSVMGHSVGEIEGIDNYATKDYVDSLFASVPSSSWPAGEYCILRKGGTCPSGFSSVTSWIDVGTHAHQMCSGNGPGDSYDTAHNWWYHCRKTWIYCCK